jgi:DNA-binding response OmpR family regulator
MAIRAGIRRVQEATMLFNPRPRVLCVDDDDDCRVMLSTLLQTQLVDAKTVGCSAEALSAIQTERFDLYSLEARLPDLNGFELCRQIRDIKPHVPILFFSGAAYEADKKLGIAAGANGYVIKPDIYSLLRSVEYFLRVAQSSFTPAVPRGVEVNVLGLSASKLRKSLLGATANTAAKDNLLGSRRFSAQTPYRNYDQH